MKLTLVLGGAAVLTAALLLVRARFWEIGPCPSCSGRRGRGRGSTAKAYNHRCRRCGGQGEIIRPLSRIYPKWREEAKRRKAKIKEARRK